MLSSNRFSSFLLFIAKVIYELPGLTLFIFRKVLAVEDLIPKFIPSDISLAKPATAMPTNSPVSLTIGPPLFPGLIGASI